MYVDFDQLPDSARVWIFQSSNPLTESQSENVSNIIHNFLENWQAHGNDLLASYKIIHNLFVVICLDENSYQATGCSIDKLTHLVQAIENELKLNLMDRMQISYVDKEEVKVLSMHKFKEALGSNLNSETQVFNNLIETKSQLFNEWQIPVKDSWHKRLLPQG